MKGRVLIIAGSDPSGGAGIQADIKTVTALGGYAATAITALTVQNTRGVEAVYPSPPEVIAAQIEAVMNDIGVDAIKIGMIGSVAAAEAITNALVQGGWSNENSPLVLDPVLVATSGDSLAEEGVTDFIRAKLVPSARLVTPNVEEAEKLTGVKITDEKSQEQAGRELLSLGTEAVLVKGGHLEGAEITDIALTPAGIHKFRHEKIETTSTHGTGCTLASAVATGLAQGMKLEHAVQRAGDYVHEAIKTAPGFGGGHGPLNHAWPVKK